MRKSEGAWKWIHVGLHHESRWSEREQVASMMLASVCLCWPLIPGGHWPVYDVQIVHVHVWCACCAYMMYQVATGQYDVQCCCHQVAWLPLWPASRWPVWEYADQYNARQLPVTWEDAVGKWNERRFILETILSSHQKVPLNFLVIFPFSCALHNCNTMLFHSYIIYGLQMLDLDFS